MAIFEGRKSTNNSDGSYIALVDSEGELVAFISPVKSVSKSLLVEALTEKGLSVEIRESKDAKTELKL